MGILHKRATSGVKRILIVDDRIEVRKYASRAFIDFARWLAPSTEKAAVIVKKAQGSFDIERPFDLLSCDINMPYFENGSKKYGQIGLWFISKFHNDFPDIPIICHSDDQGGAALVPFAHFVEKLYISDQEFNADEALLRACALDILENKMSFEPILRRAQLLEPCIELSLSSPRKLTVFIRTAKKTQDFSKLFAFARAGYLSEEQLVEILRFCLHF